MQDTVAAQLQRITGQVIAVTLCRRTMPDDRVLAVIDCGNV